MPADRWPVLPMSERALPRAMAGENRDHNDHEDAGQKCRPHCQSFGLKRAARKPVSQALAITMGTPTHATNSETCDTPR